MSTRREQRNAARRRRYGLTGDLTTFVVQTPFCAPARGAIYTALSAGVKGPPIVPVDYDEWLITVKPADVAANWATELRTLKNLQYGAAAIMWLHLAWRARFQVPTNLAVFVEHILENTDGLYVASGHRLNKRTRRIRRGVLPSGVRISGSGQAYREILDPAESCASGAGFDALPEQWQRDYKQPGQGKRRPQRSQRARRG